MTLTFATSHDGQYAVARDGREVLLFAGGAGSPIGRLDLDTDDADVALIGPPVGLVVIARTDKRATVTLHQPPYLEAVARLELEMAGKLASITGPRLAVVSPDAKQLVIVRAAAKALAQQKLEVSGPIEFVVGLERNQLLLGMLKKLEVWDAVSGRPLLRPQFQLPPPTRVLGTAAGHLWAMRQGSDEIFVYRLSDGRPFRHHAGSAIAEVICHPASPVLVLVTERGLVRLQCYAHNLSLVDGVPNPTGALAQLVIGDDISLLGYTGDREPWRLSLTGAPPAAETSAARDESASGLRIELGSMGTAAAPAIGEASLRLEGPRRETRAPAYRPWREPLAAYAAELVKGTEPELPVVAIDSELGELAHRLGLGTAARRALIALYALHLVGEPALPIARLARVIGDWPESLGQGELEQLAMLRRKHGKVSLRTAVTDLLDGTAPRHVRLVGTTPTTPRAGAFRVSRDGRADPAIESELAAQLGRLAIVTGSLAPALLEARLHGATCVTMTVPGERPTPWPRDAGLVLVLYGTASAWVADVPTLTSAETATPSGEPTTA